MICVVFFCACGIVISSLSWRVLFVFFFKQKTAYEMRISDWSSDVCSSDLVRPDGSPADEPAPLRTLLPRHVARLGHRSRRHERRAGPPDRPGDRKSVV